MYYKLKSKLLEERILGSADEIPQEDPINQQNIDMEPIPPAQSVPDVISLIPKEPAAKENEPEIKHQRKSLQPKKWMANWSSGLMGMYTSKSYRKRQSKTKAQDVSSASLLSDAGEQSFVSEMSFQSCPSPSPVVEANEVSYSVESEVSPNIKSLISSSTAFSPLFSSMTKVKIVESDKTAPAVPLSSKPKSARKLDIGWVERCTQVVEKVLEEGRVSLDSGFQSKNGSLQSVVDNPENDLSSDDEIICDSGDESSSLSCLKRKAEDSTSLATDVKKARLEVPAEQEIVAKVVPSKPVKKAEQVKKEILAKKIKDGTLNENYVKINMKKKVYARGKKNFNFGKYKKSEWKKKKRELNAGGEIGGILKCFKCGDVGHFARYCQSGKEDKLLPIDETVEDDSGLPSLEEAEEMARAAALNLPRKKNAFLKLPEVSFPFN